MKFWNNKGFSLVSVMVAAGLLGGLSLAVIQVMKNIEDVHSRANSLADEAEMMVSVRMVLDNPNYCKISLAGENPVGSPVTFEKKDIDFAGAEINAGSAFTEASEGLDVDLWYSNVAGDSRTLKKFNGADNPGSNDKSKFGKLNITSMKLVMNNGLGGCSDNYCDGPYSDTGHLVIIYEKKISSSKVRKMKKFFSVNVGMSTNSSGETTILSCSRQSSSSSANRSCPPGGFVTGFDNAGAVICKGVILEPINVMNFYGNQAEGLTTLTCPASHKAISCGIRRNTDVSNEDDFTCRVLNNTTCQFYHDESGGNDNAQYTCRCMRIVF